MHPHAPPAAAAAAAREGQMVREEECCSSARYWRVLEEKGRAREWLKRVIHCLLLVCSLAMPIP